MAQTGGRYRDALRGRDFRLLVAAFLADNVGSWAYQVVVVVYVYQRGGSAFWISAVTAAGWLTRLLATPYASVLADRLERTRLMVMSALASFAFMSGIAVVIALRAPLGLLLVLVVLANVALAPYRPAASAVVPDLVAEQDLAAANALLAGLENFVIVLGPAIGALLLLAGEPAAGAAVNAVSFLLAAGLVARISKRSVGSGASEGGSALTQFRSGVTALRGAPVALALVLFTGLDSAVYGAASVLYAPLAASLHASDTAYSLLLGAAAFGGVLAAGLANRLSASRRLAPVIVAGMLLLTLPYAVTTLVDSLAAAVALQVVAGAGMILVDVLALTALQRDIERGALSRVMGLLDVTVLGFILLASFGASALLEVAGLRTTLLVVGLGFATIAVLAIGPLLRADQQAVATMRALEPRVRMLEVLDLFSAANPRTLQRLAAALEEVSLPAGATVIRQGEPADALYVVAEGELAVTIRDQSAPARRIRTVGPLGYVGEIGLLRRMPRTATVRTVEPSRLFRLPGEEFLAAVEQGASQSLERLVTTRLTRTHPQLVAASAPTPPAVPAPS